MTNLKDLKKAELIKLGEKLGLSLKQSIKKELMIKEIEERAEKIAEERRVAANNRCSVITLSREVVEYRGAKREVAAQINKTECKIFGVINKTRFVWRYSDMYYPSIDIKGDKETISKARKLAREFILARLNKSKIDLGFKNKKQIKYVTMSNIDGVELSAFENGYIRGKIDGKDFAWNTFKYTEAAICNERYFEGSIIGITPTNRIINRVKHEGFNSFKELFSHVKAQ